MGVEDGEMSETPKQPQEQSKSTNSSENNNKKNNSRNNNNNWVYTYPYAARSYGGASGLYNLAWAQAVQNKPLNDVLVELDSKDNDNNNNDANKASDDNSNDVNKEESDIEEGELEEGEIDGDFGGDHHDDNTSNVNKSNKDDVNKVDEHQFRVHSGLEMEDGELEIQVSSIRKVLDNVTVSDANKSFDIVCARLRSSLESLRELVLHTWFPSKDDLIRQSFSALLCVNSVFSSMSSTLRDHNKDKMSRLITFVMSLSSVLFTPDQRKEIEVINTSVNPPQPPPQPTLTKPKSRDRQEELPVTDSKAILTDSSSISVNAGDNKSDFLRRPGSDKQNSEDLSHAIKRIPANLSVRGGSFGPLLDLHKVHDEDSLPSPTSKTTPTLPFSESGAPPRAVHGFPNSAMHPYETDAVKAISSYQQKFSRSSFLTQDRLPSPTPSEDGDDGGADDLCGEFSSFGTRNININDNAMSVNPPVSLQPTVLPAIAASIPAAQPLVSGLNTGPLSVGVNPASRGSGKSRDPRLRHLNSNPGSVDLNFCPSPVVPASTPNLEPLADIMNLKKNSEGPVIDSPNPKRQKNGLETMDVSEMRAVPGAIGLETSSSVGLANRGFVGLATDPRKSISGTTVSSGNFSVNPSAPFSTMSQSVATVSTADPLQSLLKGIPGNPSTWINMFKEQQKFSEPLQNVLHSDNSTSVGMQSSLPATAPTTSSGVSPTAAVSLQSPSQIAVTNPQRDPAKPRMKPRDPRRALQSNTTQKTVNHVSDPRKANGVHNVTNQGVQEKGSTQGPGNEPNTSPSSYTLAPELPDIAKQFTKNLKNIADIITSPIASSVQPPLPVSSQSGAIESSADQRTLRPGEVVAGRSQSQTQWGDVEHLFEGYDAQQRAAIQQERARRMDEQKKMFDSQKLCLVLDLDHTLLNSAKFAEVDPRHDEILRKKEEHDREQSQRHLFRFPHMAMWTKLRPGIWNFLEKACKLYELHLYTMGNKLYATEMAKVLDPKGSLFSGRVISRGDDGEPVDGDDRAPKSKDLEGVLGMESAVVIIDDSVRVWPHNKLNLIVVERYLYFPCSRRHFGLSGPSLLDCDRDERPEDGTLACCLGVVERIHQNFFANKSLDDLDVRNILASEQRKVLSGCRILFSRVFPVGEANPHLYPLWQTAEQFGAVCTNQIDEQVTHVVANAPGTDKVNWALSTGRFAVYPSWVEASAVLYRRASEQDFAIKS